MENKEKLERIKLELEELKRKKAEIDAEHRDMLRYDEATHKVTITGACVCLGSLAYSLLTKDNSGGLVIGAIGSGIIGESILFNSSNLHYENREFNNKLKKAIEDCKNYLGNKGTNLTEDRILDYEDYLSEYHPRSYVKDSIVKGIVGNAIIATIGMSILGGFNLYKNRGLKNDSYSSSSIIYEDTNNEENVITNTSYTLKKTE